MGITGRDTRASSGCKARCFLSPSGHGDKVSDDDNEVETIAVSHRGEGVSFFPLDARNVPLLLWRTAVPFSNSNVWRA